MALKFKCQSCGEDIIVRYLKIGEFADCEHCGTRDVVPETAIEIKESTTVVEYTGFGEGFWRGAIGFGVGGAVAVLVTALGSIAPILLPFRKPVIINLFFGLGLPIIGFASGGAIGGASLHRGRKVVIGFGIGWAILGFVIPITLMGTQGWSGEGSVFGALLVFALIFAVGFGVAAMIGTAFMRLGVGLVLAGAGAFSMGGAIGGFLCGLTFYLPRFLPGILIVIGILIANSVGGALLGAKIASLERQGEDEERRA